MGGGGGGWLVVKRQIWDLPGGDLPKLASVLLELTGLNINASFTCL